MNSLLFVYIETETEKLSGHVDLTARCQSLSGDSFLKKILSSGYSLRISSHTSLDLNNFYPAHETSHTLGEHFTIEIYLYGRVSSWQKNKLRHGKSDNWRLHGDEASLSLEHLASGTRYCAVPRLRGNTAPWKHLDTKEKHVKIHCLDIKLR